MYRYSKFIKIVCLSLLPMFSMAQSITNSPYTRYGWGNLLSTSTGASSSMGGVSLGVRSGSQLNPANPATYGEIGSRNFLFDIGASGGIQKLSDGSNKQQYNNGSLDYIALGFPLSNKVGVSAGMLPFSTAGYGFNSVESIKLPNGAGTGIIAQQDYKGSGGMSQLYAGVGVNITKDFSLGANIAYLFGSTNHTRSLSFPSDANIRFYEEIARARVADVRFDLGMQYTFRLKEKESLTLGLVYSPQKKLNTDTEIIVNSGTGTTTDSTRTDVSNYKFSLPHSFGFGLSYNKENKLILGADIHYDMWKDAKYFSKTDTLNNRLRVALGGEYTPNHMSDNAFKFIKYRLGVGYERTYMTIRGESINSYFATAGLGIPFRAIGSTLNIGFEYSYIPSSNSNKLKESNYKLSLGLIFSERWFRKIKFN